MPCNRVYVEGFYYGKGNIDEGTGGETCLWGQEQQKRRERQRETDRRQAENQRRERKRQMIEK